MLGRWIKIIMGSTNKKYPILETFKNIILSPQDYKVIKTVLINSYDNLGNTKIHDNCKPKK